MSEYIAWFQDVGLNDRPKVGGKGCSLGELERAGIRVPPGFVITTEAFEDFLNALDPDGAFRKAISQLRPDALEEMARVTRGVRERIEETPLPYSIVFPLGEAFRRLLPGDSQSPVAVRSSATSEDSADASFAGLQDTYLWVKGEQQLVDSVRACWGSLYSDESVAYRRRLDMPEDQVAMGVVVQKMVDARCAGVMFTCSPTSGDRSVVAVSASWGLGSALVGGEVTPDEYMVSKVTGTVKTRTIAPKAVRHVPDPAGGIRTEEVPEAQQTEECVADQEIGELVQLAKKVETHYGCPQDIEWAIANGGTFPENVYLLQSRPETVWSAKKAGQPVFDQGDSALDYIMATVSGGIRSR